MKRNLIATVAATLALVATGAFADSSLDGSMNRLNAPESTSYQADVQTAGVQPIEAQQHYLAP